MIFIKCVEIIGFQIFRFWLIILAVSGVICITTVLIFLFTRRENIAIIFINQTITISWHPIRYHIKSHAFITKFFVTLFVNIFTQTLIMPIDHLYIVWCRI